MTNQEFIGAGLFVCFVGGVAYCTARILCLGLWRWWCKQPAPKRSTFRQSARVGVLVVAVLGACCIAWGYFVEPYRVQLSRIEINSPKLVGATRPIRIVHLSDAHCDMNPGNEDSVIEMVAEIKPDVILFTGDAVNTREALGRFRQMMQQLVEIAPVYACYGNWDNRRWKDEIYHDTGVNVLDETGQAVHIAGADLFIAGVSTVNTDMTAVLAQRPADAYCIMLHHFPAFVEKAAGLDVDLCLAGHTHGGQVAMPLYGALVTLDRLGKRYEAGLYKVRETSLYVSRGLGMEGGHAPRVRFWSTPEVTLLEINPVATQSE